MLVMLVDSGKVSFANLGHVEWTSCTTRRLAWSFARSTALGALQRILRGSRAVV